MLYVELTPFLLDHWLTGVGGDSKEAPPAHVSLPRALEDAGPALLPCSLLPFGRLCHSQAQSCIPAWERAVLGPLGRPRLAEG